MYVFLLLVQRRPPLAILFPYTTLFRSICRHIDLPRRTVHNWLGDDRFVVWFNQEVQRHTDHWWKPILLKVAQLAVQGSIRSEEHTSELQSSQISYAVFCLKKKLQQRNR